MATNKTQEAITDRVQRWPAKASPTRVCMHFSQQGVKSISLPVEPGLALWLVLTKRMWLK